MTGPRVHPPTLSDLDTPALIIDYDIMRANRAAMQDLAGGHGITLRPHIKTHKSVELAKQQLQAGAAGVACAKLGEAEVMAKGGVDDIQIANQIVGPQKIERLMALNGRVRKLSVAVESVDNSVELSAACSGTNSSIDVLIELDSGLHRAGLDNIRDVVAFARRIIDLPGLHLIGVMTHAGHAYAARSIQEVETIGLQEGRMAVDAAQALRDQGHAIAVVSVGSTPTARFCASVAGVTELRVGNYLFADRMQIVLGAASEHSCALTVLTTVTARPTPTRGIIDAGAKVFSSDRGAHGQMTLEGFGIPWLSTSSVHPKVLVERLSEEHGILRCEAGAYPIGSRLRVIPNHACAVINLFDEAWLVSGEQIVERIAISARGRVQ